MSKTGQLRIIGGQWRGRKLSFPAINDLRPTADRVRETLFNWLQAEIPGARCLDLFAGSGAIGLEALSRGAAELVLVEQNPTAAAQIRQHLEKLGSHASIVKSDDVFRFLKGSATQFDVVFLDPPYRLDCLEQCCRLLEQGGWLKQKAWIYLEDSSHRSAPRLPANWQLMRSKKAGDVGYFLALREAETAEAGS